LHSYERNIHHDCHMILDQARCKSDDAVVCTEGFMQVRVDHNGLQLQLPCMNSRSSCEGFLALARHGTTDCTHGTVSEGGGGGGGWRRGVG
jgi:hypothetical protein